MKKLFPFLNFRVNVFYGRDKGTQQLTGNGNTQAAHSKVAPTKKEIRQLRRENALLKAQVTDKEIIIALMKTRTA